MIVKLLLVAEVEVSDDTLDPEDAALRRIESLDLSLHGIDLWQPAIGPTIEEAGCKHVEVYY